METKELILEEGDYVLSKWLWKCVDIYEIHLPESQIIYGFESDGGHHVELTESELLNALDTKLTNFVTPEEAMIWKLKN